MNTEHQPVVLSPLHMEPRPFAFFIDLVLYLAVMFLIREVYFSSVGVMVKSMIVRVV